MATSTSQPVLCGQCPEDNPPPAEMYCVDCELSLCLRCIRIHKRNKKLVGHKFVTSESVSEAVKKDINNQTQVKRSNEEPVSKILASRTTLEKMLEGVHINKQPWNVRRIKGSFREMVEIIKPVKTIENLSCRPYRLGVVNCDIWIKHGERGSGDVAVYNKHLSKVREHQWKEVRGVSTVQQVSESEVMILTPNGLHVTDTEGRYLYKVMDGEFTDITMDDNNVIVIAYQQNKVINLSKKGDRWQSQSHIVVDDPDKNIKTLQLQDNNKLLIAVNWSERVLQVDIESGEILQQFESGTESSELGQFNSPYIVGIDEGGEVIVCDRGNDRVQVLDASGKWHEVKIQGIERPIDVIIIENSMYVLHGTKENRKITKYQI